VILSEPAERRVISARLRESGFHVHEFRSAAGFLSHPSSAGVDIAIVGLGAGDGEGAQLADELAKSILFGPERGSFTGATESRLGCFRLADGGTLFLDEVSDMPMTVQPKLLRVLDGGPVVPVGGKEGESVDVRVIAATNADLQKKIASPRSPEPQLQFAILSPGTFS
jgi:DNA-binding NtrC family response regulator